MSNKAKTIRTKSERVIKVPDELENTEFTQQAIADGTSYSDEELAQFETFSKATFVDEKFKSVVRKDAARRLGRPLKTNPKKPISIRLSPEVIDYFRNTGKGWQTKLDQVLKEYVDRH